MKINAKSYAAPGRWVSCRARNVVACSVFKEIPQYTKIEYTEDFDF
jgi:hypothetical protein